MKKPNFQWILKNWDAVIDLLCEECTPHDVIYQVEEYLERSFKKAETLKISLNSFKEAKVLLEQVRAKINPDKM